MQRAQMHLDLIHELRGIARRQDGGGGVAINGGTTLGADGRFSGATLTQGTMSRSPCTGVWSEVEQEITVTCGSTGNECLVEMRRSGP